MAHGVESRLPFVDYRLVEFLFACSNIKIYAGEIKWVLREYLRRNGQERIASRPDKQGYPTPIERWLAADEGALAKEVLLAGDSRVQEFCDLGVPIRWLHTVPPGNQVRATIFTV
jgi:asparagine synthase (glutamine-hydrolysing)